ncbi:hypothetical protein AGMMS49587_13770 [Spirochaetia bacterium]|nr:hypothetical protein AGMMS49587_13770 [Spirochaetia bacterium]
MDIAVSPVLQKGAAKDKAENGFPEPPVIEPYRISFTLKDEEEYRLALPFEDEELLLRIQGGGDSLEFKLKTQ